MNTADVRTCLPRFTSSATRVNNLVLSPFGLFNYTSGQRAHLQRLTCFQLGRYDVFFLEEHQRHEHSG